MFSSRQGFTLPFESFGNTAFFSSTTNASRFLSTTSTANLINVTNSNGFTLEYWVYPTNMIQAIPGNTSSINPGPGNQDRTSTNNWCFGPFANVNLANVLQFYYYDTPAGAGRTIQTANNTLTVNTWYNISFVTTTSGGNTIFTMYINGIRQDIRKDLSSSYSNTITIPSANLNYNTSIDFSIGYYNYQYLQGYIDEIRVSNIARYSGASYNISTSPFNNDANTQLLIQCNGSNGSTSFTDSSNFNRIITNNSNLVTISNQVVL